MAGSEPDLKRLRLLVGIASYGEKNLDLLKSIIRGYREMPFDVRVVVLSNAPKDLGAEADVVVGLPSKDPWSLPFAHKKLFAENVEHYDLFLYSEDDIRVTESNINAFLRLTPSLADNEIAGFLHYEQDPHGDMWMVCVHRHFHWKADSVIQRGGETVAEFTNLHSACYLLTQSQLRTAIASEGFLREPYEAEYDVLCTAATDPYTNCGFRKVICISALENFLIHHMPNKYVNSLDVPLAAFQEQVRTLLRIRDGNHPGCNLFNTEARFRHFWWQKSYYEKPDDNLLRMIPRATKSVLSIGCGWGATEARLKERGAKVTALPLDSVIGEVAARRGIEVIYGTWDECRGVLKGRQFDCVLVVDMFHLQPEPGQLIGQCSCFVRAGGTFVAGGPNFDRWQWLVKRVFGVGEFRKLRSFGLSGISVCGPGTLGKAICDVGLRLVNVQWLDHVLVQGQTRGRIQAGRFKAKDWLLQARREAPPEPMTVKSGL